MKYSTFCCDCGALPHIHLFLVSVFTFSDFLQFSFNNSFIGRSNWENQTVLVSWVKNLGVGWGFRGKLFLKFIFRFEIILRVSPNNSKKKFLIHTTLIIERESCKERSLIPHPLSEKWQQFFSSIGLWSGQLTYSLPKCVICEKTSTNSPSHFQDYSIVNKTRWLNFVLLWSMWIVHEKKFLLQGFEPISFI